MGSKTSKGLAAFLSLAVLERTGYMQILLAWHFTHLTEELPCLEAYQMRT